MKKIVLLYIITFNLVLFSQEKIVNEIIIKGAIKTKIPELKKIVDIKENSKLDSIGIENSIIMLKRLPAISHAYFQVFHSHENKYNVIVNVEENFTIIPEFNLWTTTNKQTAYKIGLNEYNFLGRNIGLGVFYQNNGFDSYGVNFRAPTLFSKKWGLAVNFQNWISEEPLYFDDKTANYKYQNISYELLGLHQINFKNNLQFGVSYFKEKYNYLTGDTAVNVPLELNV